MKFLKFLLWTLAGAVLLGLIAYAILLSPSVQTGWVQGRLAKHTDWQTTIGEASVGWSSTALDNLRLERSGALITAPRVEAQFSLLKALRTGEVEIEHLAAKGWVIDLTRQPSAPAEAGGEKKNESTTEVETTTPTPVATETDPVMDARVRSAMNYFVKEALKELRLPCARIDGLELEGDVMVRSPFDGDPHRVHVQITGGGLQASHEGAIKFTTRSVLVNFKDGAITTVNLDGMATARIGADRSVTAITLKTDATAEGTHVPGNPAVAITASLTREEAGGTAAVEISKDGHALLNLTAEAGKTSEQLAGTWQAAFSDADLIYFGGDASLPKFSLHGKGRFATAAGAAAVSASGDLTGALGAGATFNGLTLAKDLQATATFEAGVQGPALHLERLTVSLATDRPLADIKMLQPADVDLKQRAIKVARPETAWAEVSLPALPLAWLEPYLGGLKISAGEMAGHLFLKWENGGIAVEPDGPLLAKNASLAYGDTALLDQVDISATATAKMITGGAVSADISSLEITKNGRQLIQGKALLTPATDAGQPQVLSGQWTADLGALAKQPMLKTAGALDDLKASGDFSTTLGAGASMDAKLAINDQNKPVFSANISATDDGAGGLRLETPVKIIHGDTFTELRIEGSWARDGSGGDIYLTGEKVKLDDLKHFGDSLGALIKLPVPVSALSTPVNKTRDVAPFWGAWTGSIRYSFLNLDTGHGALRNVSGKLLSDGTRITLSGIRWALDDTHSNTLEGSLVFDAAAPAPYVLRTKGIVGKLDATGLFPVTEKADQLVQGKFAMDITYDSDGANPADLLASARQTFHITSTIGIVRILKVQVGDVLKEKERPVKDAAASVGGAFVTLFGGKGKDVDSVNHVGRRAQTVLDFTTHPDVMEIGYDKLSLDAIVAAHGGVSLENIVLTAPNVRLTGKGSIKAGAKPMNQRELSLDLNAGFKETLAQQLRLVGLLKDKKDADGYALLDGPIHFAGTMAKMDNKAWHDLLAGAMSGPELPPEPKKKREKPKDEQSPGF